MIRRIALVVLVAIAIVGCGGDSDASQDTQTTSDEEIRDLTEQVAERYGTSETTVAAFVGQFASAGGADLDRGTMLEIMLELPRDKYPDVEDAAAQAAWQLVSQ